MKLRLNSWLPVAFTCMLLTGAAHAQDTLGLPRKQEKQLSKTKLRTRLMGTSTFSSYASFLYAANIATLHSESPEVNNTRLQPLPDPDKEITLRELLDEIARQTDSRWTYDATKDYWVFVRPCPFEVELAEGWKKEKGSGFIIYRPPTASVGMDIYYAGRVGDNETANEARTRIARTYAGRIRPGITEDSMQEISTARYKSLYYKTMTKKGVMWRQWAIADQGKCFVIVSAIKPNDEPAVLPDVEKMVQSFRVVEEGWN